MAITPKMLGSGISSGILRVACNEGAPMYYGRRTTYTGRRINDNGNITRFAAKSYSAHNYPDEMLHDYMWTDGTHLYEYNSLPTSVRVYDITYEDDGNMKLTFNREMYTNISYFNDSTSVLFYVIGYIGRKNKMYIFYRHNDDIYISELIITDTITVSTRSIKITLSGRDTRILIIESPDSDEIKIVTYYPYSVVSSNTTTLQSYVFAGSYKLSSIISDTTALTQIFHETNGIYNLAVFDKDQLLCIKDANGYGNLLTFNHSTMKYDVTAIKSGTKYARYNKSVDLCKASGIVHEYDNFIVFSFSYGIINNNGETISKNGSTTYTNYGNTAIYKFFIDQCIDIPLPYAKNMPTAYGRFNIYAPNINQEYFSSNLHNYVTPETSIIQLLSSLSLGSDSDNYAGCFNTGDITYTATGTANNVSPTAVGVQISQTPGILNTSIIHDHIFLCLNYERVDNEFSNMASLLKYNCAEFHYHCVNDDNDRTMRFTNSSMSLAFPKGFYASNFVICHDNRVYGISRIDYNNITYPKYINPSTSGGATEGHLLRRSPYKSLMVSIMDYDADTDTFSQSYAGLKPIVAKSNNIQEVVSITISKAYLKKNKYFDAINFDYGKDCKIVMRDSATGNVITIYEGDIQNVFDFSSHPIILNPGYELFVLTVFEAWQCTAFGIEIT